MRHLKDLRDYIAALEEIGEIQRVGTEVDWNLEIGAVIRRSYDLRAPAPLFTSITGYAGCSASSAGPACPSPWPGSWPGRRSAG